MGVEQTKYFAISMFEARVHVNLETAATKCIKIRQICSDPSTTPIRDGMHHRRIYSFADTAPHFHGAEPAQLSNPSAEAVQHQQVDRHISIDEPMLGDCVDTHR